MKVLFSYLCVPWDIVAVVIDSGILKFTMKETARWKRVDWDAVGGAIFEQEAVLLGDGRKRFSQRLQVDVENDASVALLMRCNDICEIYAAHFAEDGRVFFQGFERVVESDRALRGSSSLTTSGKYTPFRGVGEGFCIAGKFVIEGRSRTLATVVEAENAAAQEQFLQNV